jgi:hypothetical protein
LIIAFERKVSRKIFGTTKERDGTWRIKTNYELDRLIKKEKQSRYRLGVAQRVPGN